MDKRNEYRIRASGYQTCHLRLEYRKWWNPFRWHSIDIASTEEELRKKAVLHAEGETPTRVKSLGRLP